MGKRLVFIGAGHAHLTAISNLSRYIADGHEVVVISAGRYHYYSGMGPGLLSGHYEPQEVRFNVEELTRSRGGIFIHGRAASVDPYKKQVLLQNGQKEPYDVLSFNTGSEIATGPLDTSYDTIYNVKPVENMFTARCRIMAALDAREPGAQPVHVVVTGGGAAGVEMSANAWRIAHDMGKPMDITLVVGGTILHRFAPRVRRLALKSLQKKNIRLEEHATVIKNTGQNVVLDDGREIPFDFAFAATGTRPSGIFKDSGLPVGPQGGLLVNRFLQSTQYPDIFGGGDCIDFAPRPLDKVGVYAVRENAILMNNLHAALSGGSMDMFIPQSVYLLVLNMGDGTGIFNRKSISFGGRLAFKLKDRIDRKFMKWFQLCDEKKETVDCPSWDPEPGVAKKSVE